MKLQVIDDIVLGALNKLSGKIISGRSSRLSFYVLSIILRNIPTEDITIEI